MNQQISADILRRAQDVIVEGPAPVEPSGCCTSDVQATCCEPEDKAECCGESTSADSGCGCQ